MKFKTTRKAIVDGTPANKLFSAGYCDLQHLLRNHDPIAYTHGVYGWNFDVYQVYGITICTGYRGMPGKTVVHSRDYEKQAEELLGNWNMPYEEKTEKLENLLKMFCKEQELNA